MPTLDLVLLIIAFLLLLLAAFRVVPGSTRFDPVAAALALIVLTLLTS